MAENAVMLYVCHEFCHIIWVKWFLPFPVVFIVVSCLVPVYVGSV